MFTALSCKDSVGVTHPQAGETQLALNVACTTRKTDTAPAAEEDCDGAGHLSIMQQNSRDVCGVPPFPGVLCRAHVPVCKQAQRGGGETPVSHAPAHQTCADGTKWRGAVL